MEYFVREYTISYSTSNTQQMISDKNYIWIQLYIIFEYVA